MLNDNRTALFKGGKTNVVWIDLHDQYVLQVFFLSKWRVFCVVQKLFFLLIDVENEGLLISQRVANGANS